jgi:hypothetical protein
VTNVKSFRPVKPDLDCREKYKVMNSSANELFTQDIVEISLLVQYLLTFLGNGRRCDRGLKFGFTTCARGPFCCGLSVGGIELGDSNLLFPVRAIFLFNWVRALLTSEMYTKKLCIEAIVRRISMLMLPTTKSRGFQ